MTTKNLETSTMTMDAIFRAGTCELQASTSKIQLFLRTFMIVKNPETGHREINGKKSIIVLDRTACQQFFSLGELNNNLVPKNLYHVTSSMSQFLCVLMMNDRTNIFYNVNPINFFITEANSENPKLATSVGELIDDSNNKTLLL